MWLADYLRGKNVLPLAGSNSEAAELSRRVQAKLIQFDTVRPPHAALSDGNQAGTGDLIRARLNTTINAGGRELTNRDTLKITGWRGPHAQCGAGNGTNLDHPIRVPRAYPATTPSWTTRATPTSGKAVPWTPPTCWSPAPCPAGPCTSE